MSKSISDKSILGALTVNDKNVPVISYSDTTPTSPAVGDLWFNTSNGYTYLYYNDGSSSQWVSISNSGAGAQGVVSATSPLSYNSSTQNISLDTVAVASGGTGATTAAGARTNLDAAQTAHVHSASDITSGILDINRMPIGSVIQAQYYFNSTFNYYNTSSLTDVSSSLRLNFTPKLSNSKMIVICAMNWLHEGTHRQVVRLLRNGSMVGSDMWFSSAITYGWTTVVMNHMWEDSAAHTANTQITYSFQTATSSNNMYYNYSFDGQPGSSNYVILEVKT